MDNLAKLALEDGTILKGEAFGYKTTNVGEVVFSTGMSGYTESLTDPSFKGEILMSTYPLEGNYGVDTDWYQSDKIQTEGYVVREVCRKPTCFGASKTLDEFLNEFEIPCISGIDTRNLTLKIREYGSLKGAISTENISDDELLKLAKEQPSIQDLDLVEKVSTKEVKVYGEDLGLNVALIDCGVKKNIIQEFLNKDMGVTLFPYNSSKEDILDYNPDGLMVSCGPGNPERLLDTIDTVKSLVNSLPVFGICMGQQIVAKAFGAKIFKMKFGHRGANQPVKDLNTGKVFITSQNHGFCVDSESIKDTPLKLSQINLNDNTPEGFEHEELVLKSVQFHPEAGPGPNDTRFIFDEFKEMINTY